MRRKREGGKEREGGGKIIANLHIHTKIAEHDTRAREDVEVEGCGAMERGCVDDGRGGRGAATRTGGWKERGRKRVSRRGTAEGADVPRGGGRNRDAARERRERCFSRATALVPASRYSWSLRQREIAVTRVALSPRNFSRGLDSVTSVRALRFPSVSLFSSTSEAKRSRAPTTCVVSCRVVVDRHRYRILNGTGSEIRARTRRERMARVS